MQLGTEIRNYFTNLLTPTAIVRKSDIRYCITITRMLRNRIATCWAYVKGTQLFITEGK